jgi:hypothetical protein
MILIVYLLVVLLGNLILSEKKVNLKNISWLFATPLLGICALIIMIVLSIPFSLFGFNFQLTLALVSMLFLVLLIGFKSKDMNTNLIFKILARTFMIFIVSVMVHQLITRLFRPIFTYDSFLMLEISRDIVFGNIDFKTTPLADWSLSYIGMQIVGVILDLEYINGVFGVILILTLISITFSVGLNFRDIRNFSDKFMVYLFFASIITLAFSQIFQTMIYYQNGHALVLAVFSLLLINTATQVDGDQFQLHMYQVILLASLPLLRVEGFVYWLSFFFYYLSRYELEKRNLYKIALTLTPASGYYAIVFFLSTYSEANTSFFLITPLINIGLLILLFFRNRSIFFEKITNKVHYPHLAFFAYILVFLFSFDASITSLFAVIANLFVTGLWGLFWFPTLIAFFRLVLSDVKESAFLAKNFFLAPLLLILCSGGARGIPFRLTWGDSGNRMIFHLCLAIPIIALLHLKSLRKFDVS